VDYIPEREGLERLLRWQYSSLQARRVRECKLRHAELVGMDEIKRNPAGQIIHTLAHASQVIPLDQNGRPVNRLRSQELILAALERRIGIA